MSACGYCGQPGEGPICRDCASLMHGQPEPTDEQFCGSNGHAYYGDEEGAPVEERGRCYCGARRYPAVGAGYETQETP